jgi:hypothetical protein
MLQRTLILAGAVALASLGATPVGSVAGAPGAWAPAATAPIHPGVMTFTNGTNQCTSNFVFADATDVYLGQSAHCGSIGGATETNGCLAPSMPLNTPVQINGATQPGELVYSSWLTMQSRNETDAATCQYNDFALVRLDPADHSRVNPSVPVFGGPVGVASAVANGARVFSYGNSSLRFGITTLSPKEGVKILSKGGGWNHLVYTATPGIPGDSGSGFLDASGKAFGALSTLNVLPEPAGNGVADLAKALAYLHANTSLGAVQLVVGTEAWRGGQVI